MKQVKKKLMLTSAMAAALCGCLALTACQNNDPPAPKPTEFDPPANVSVVADLLSWNAVDGASNGYTVRINSDETTTVTVTELDLKTVTEKFSAGNNTLSVKVNATDTTGASAYSATVTYSYTPSVPQKTPFAKPTATVTGDTVSWNAVDGATNGYTVKIGTGTLTVNSASLDLTSEDAVRLLVRGDNAISVKVNGTTEHDESEYSTAVNYNYSVSSEEEAQSFIAAVNDIGTVALDSKAKVELAKAKYEALSDEAKEEDGVDAAIAALKQKDCAFFALLVAEIDEVTEDSAVADFESVKTAIDTAVAYELIDETGAAEQKSALTAAKTAYETLVKSIKDGVDDFVDTIYALLQKDYTETEPVRKDYDDLEEQKTALGALKPYAAKYYSEEYSFDADDLTAKQEEICAIPVKTEKSESSVFINRDHGANSAIYVVCKFTNILDKALVMDHAPNITVNGVEDTSGELVTYNATAKAYVYKVAFDCPASDGETTVTYKIGKDELVTKTIKYPSSIIYSSNDEHKFMIGGNLTCYGATGAPLYADVYAESDITATGRDADISVSGDKLATVEISNGMTEDALKSALARANVLGENLKLRLVIYELTEDDVYSTINSSSVSETLTYSIDEEMKKLRIPFTVVNGALEVRDDGSFICGSDFNYGNIVGAFNDTDVTEANVRDQLRYHVTIYKAGEKMGDFHASIPGNATLDANTIKRNVYRFCGETTADDNIAITVSIDLAENSEYADKLRESLTSPQKAWNFTATEADARFTGNGLNNVKIDTTEKTDGSIAYGSYEWVRAGIYDNDVNVYNDYFHAYHDGLALLVFDATDVDDADSYDFVANNVKPFAVYTHTTWDEIQWSKVNAEIDKVWGKLPAAQKSNEKKFVFAIQVIANADGIEMGFKDSLPKYYIDNNDEAKHAVVTYERDFSVPTNNQIRLASDFMEFMRENTSANGAIIYDEAYGVKHIEVKFTINGNDYHAYIMLDDEYYANHDGEENWRLIGMYASTDKSGTRLALDYAANGWCNFSDGANTFVDFVNANKAIFGIENNITATTTVTLCTKIVHDNTYFNNVGDYSATVTFNPPATGD